MALCCECCWRLLLFIPLKWHRTMILVARATVLYVCIFLLFAQCRYQPIGVTFLFASISCHGYFRTVVQNLPCPKPAGTIKGVLRRSPGVSRKLPSTPFRALATCCLLSWQRLDLTMLTLMLKWPPADWSFTALWRKPLPPFIPTCAPQIFKIGLHKHCRAGEMIPNAFWRKPVIL